MKEQPVSESFSFSDKSQSIDPFKQMTILQFEYDRIKKKYEKLKLKYQEHSDQQEMMADIQTINTHSENFANKPKISYQKPFQQVLRLNQNSIKQNLSDEFSWHQHSNQNHVLEAESSILKATNNLENFNSSINVSQTSDHFAFDQTKINCQNNQNFPQNQSIDKKFTRNIQAQKSVERSKSKNSENFSFSNSFNVTISTDKISHRVQAQNNSENVELSQLKDTSKSFKKRLEVSQSHQSEKFVYQSEPSQNQSQNFPNNQSVKSKQQNSDNFSFSVSKSNDFKHQDLADSNNFQLDQSEILSKNQQRKHNFQKQEIAKEKQSIQQKKPQNQKKGQHEISSMKSYDDSKPADTEAFKYQLKEFSFRLPEQINDLIEINYSTIQPNNLENPNQINFPKSPNKNRELTAIQQNFDYQQLSDEDQTEFYRKLINKLSVKRKIHVSQIKKVSVQMQKLSEKYDFFQEIFQTGTYQLNLTQTHELPPQFFQQFKTWNKTLITEIALKNDWPYASIDFLFKNFQFPSLKSVTFRIYDSIVTTKSHFFKQPNSNFDLQFLRYFGLSKKLKSLTLKGETLTEQISTSIVDLDFPLLKTLYLGFQAPFTNEVVNILLCNQLRNLPKCKIYIATWEGTADDRFNEYFHRIDFQFLQTDSEDI